MGTDETYNGWTNRETWAVALWINNDEGWLESVRDALDVDMTPGAAGDTIRENVECLLTADGYRETFGEAIPESLVRIAEDIGSLYRVNWAELGESFLSDLSEGD